MGKRRDELREHVLRLTIEQISAIQDSRERAKAIDLHLESLLAALTFPEQGARRINAIADELVRFVYLKADDVTAAEAREARGKATE
jgi:hypothetical protein